MSSRLIYPAITAGLAGFLSFVSPFAAADASLPSDKYEQPRYQVVEKVENIEIRRYEPMLLAEVVVEGDRSTAVNRAFRILAGYIFGGNTARDSNATTATAAPNAAQGERIAMTSPVTQVEAKSERIAMTSPVTQVPVDTASAMPRWTIAFMMPSNYTLATLPKPNDSRVSFRMTDPATRVAIRFAGISSQSNLGQHRKTLDAFVAERKLTTVGEPTIAYYDDPFTLPWKRRNEWWVDVRSLVEVAAK